MKKRVSEHKKWKLFVVQRTDLPNVYEFIERPLEAGLWCLCISKQEFHQDYLSFEQLEEILREFLDLPISKEKLKKAFARAGVRIVKHRENGTCKISHPGEEYLYGLKPQAPLTVTYVNPNKPRSATKTLEALIKSLPKGILLITDPYYGVKTFGILEMFASYHKEIKFLTSKLGGGEKISIINNLIKDFQKEFGKRIELKMDTTKELHDRYIIAQNILFIIGQGIKDLGVKESFIVGVEDRYGKDMRKIIEKTFYERWAKAKNLY